MDIKKAIEVLNAELQHTKHHIQYENKAKEYYEEMQDIIDATEMAISALEMQEGVITPQEFYERMKDLADGRDREAVHRSMDDLMCEALRSLGYSDGIEVFEDTAKWYA